MVRLSLVLVVPAGSPPPYDDLVRWKPWVDDGVVVTDMPEWAEAAHASGFRVAAGCRDLGLARERGRMGVIDGWVWYAEAGELPAGGDVRSWIQTIAADHAEATWVEADRVEPDLEAVVGGEGRLTAPHLEVRLARADRPWATGPAPRLRAPESAPARSPAWVVARLRAGRIAWIEAERAARDAVSASADGSVVAAASRRMRGLGASAYAAELARRAAAVAAGPARVGAAVARALSALDAGELAVAVDIVRDAREEGGSTPDLDLLEARALLRLGGPSGARRAAELAERAAIVGDPGWIPRAGTPEAARLTEMEAWLAAGDLDRAERAWRQLSRVQRRGTAARLGRLEIDARRLVPGVAAEIAARSEASGPDAWAIGAYAAERAADITLAMLFLDRLAGETSWMAPHRAELARQAQASLAAEATLRRLDGGVERWDLEDPCAEAEALAGAGRLDEAHRAAVEALRRDPADVGGWVDLAVILDRAGLSDPAVLAMRAAVELDPHDPDRRAGLAALCGRARLYADAALHARRAGERDDMRAWLMALGAEGPIEPGEPDVSVVVERPGSEVLDRLALARGRRRLEVFALGGSPSGRWPFPVVALPEGGAGRQAAIELAKGAALWFLTADARPGVDDLTGRRTDRPARVVAGRTWIAHRHLRDARDRALAAPVPDDGPAWRAATFDDLWVPTALARRVGPDVASFADGGAREWALRLLAAGAEIVRLPGVMLDRRMTVAEAVRRAEAAGAEEVAIRTLHSGAPGTLDVGARPEAWIEALRSVVELAGSAAVEAEAALRRAPENAATLWGGVRDAAVRRGVAGATVARRCSPFPALAATSVVLVQDPRADDDAGLARATDRVRRDAHGPVELVVVHHTGFGRAVGAWDVRRVRVPAGCAWEERVNLGLREAKGATALVIDEGARLVPSWRPRLLAHLDAWSDVGLVAALRASTDEDLRGAGELFADAHRGAHAWPVSLPHTAMVLRRELWTVVGGLMPGLGPLAWTDLGLRARRAGFRVRHAGDVLVGGVRAWSPEPAEEALFRARWGVDAADREGLRGLAEPFGPAPDAPRIPSEPGVPHLLLEESLAPAPLRHVTNREAEGASSPAEPVLIYET